MLEAQQLLLNVKKKELMKYLYLIASQQDKIFAQLNVIWSFGFVSYWNKESASSLEQFYTMECIYNQFLENLKRVVIWWGEGYYSCDRPH